MYSLTNLRVHHTPFSSPGRKGGGFSSPSPPENQCLGGVYLDAGEASKGRGGGRMCESPAEMVCYERIVRRR